MAPFRECPRPEIIVADPGRHIYIALKLSTIEGVSAFGQKPGVGGREECVNGIHPTPQGGKSTALTDTDMGRAPPCGFLEAALHCGGEVVPGRPALLHNPALVLVGGWSRVRYGFSLRLFS